MSRDIRELERWIEEHPVLAFVNTFGLAIFVVELAAIMRLSFEWVARCVR